MSDSNTQALKTGASTAETDISKDSPENKTAEDMDITETKHETNEPVQTGKVYKTC